MPTLMDDRISRLPIRIIDLKVDPSTLYLQQLKILQAGHLPGRTLQRSNVVFEHWAVAYIVGGEGIVQIDQGPVQPIEAGSVFFVVPGKTYTYGPEPGGYWDEYYIRMEGGRVEEWLASGLLQDAEQVRRVGLDEKWTSKIETLFMLLESGIAANADRASMVLESLIFEFCLASGKRESHRTEAVFAILEDIAGSLYQPLDARKIAALHHISVPTLRRIVRRHSGYPLHEYINRLKVAEAKKLLLNTDMQVKEIAHALCIEDALYFSRLFKKYAGISANRFREST